MAVDKKRINEVSQALSGKADVHTGRVSVYIEETNEVKEVWPVDAAELIAAGTASFEGSAAHRRIAEAEELALEKAGIKKATASKRAAASEKVADATKTKKSSNKK